MGLNIGSLISGLNLPNLNLGNIGQDVLSEGESLLKDVVKDSFTLSNSPGQTFASTMNLDAGPINATLPNPIGSLANKLLSGADSELNKFGVNVDFKSLLQNLFNLPTQSGSNVTVPSVATRAATGSLPGVSTSSTPAMGVGGGGAPSTSGVGGGGASVTTASTGSVASVSGNPLGNGDVNAAGFDDSLTTLGNAQSSVEGQINSMISQLNSGGSLSSAQLMADQAQLSILQQEMQSINEMFSTLSQIMNDEHQTKMQIISNIK